MDTYLVVGMNDPIDEAAFRERIPGPWFVGIQGAVRCSRLVTCSYIGPSFNKPSSYTRYIEVYCGSLYVAPPVLSDDHLIKV